jgi:hypothetical protein
MSGDRASRLAVKTFCCSAGCSTCACVCVCVQTPDTQQGWAVIFVAITWLHYKVAASRKTCSQICILKIEYLSNLHTEFILQKINQSINFAHDVLHYYVLKILKICNETNTRWFKYDRDWLCVNKSQFVPVIFEPLCTSFSTINGNTMLILIFCVPCMMNMQTIQSLQLTCTIWFYSNAFRPNKRPSSGDAQCWLLSSMWLLHLISLH